ncbi:MAG: hypothetical protein L6R37_006817 [Teloschistes peruensis]|nr:MAG: hypothetical protein L6R37_006817 [Teloschistes peruensis]
MEPGTAAAAYGVETAVEGAVGAAAVIAKPTMPLKAAWRQMATSKALPRSSHSISVVKGMAYVFGGEEKPRQPVDNHMHVLTLPSSTVNEVDYRCFSAESPQGKDEVPPPRVGHTAAVVGDRIYVFGGRGGKSMEALNEEGAVWEYDTKFNQWSRLKPVKDSPAPQARSYHSTASTAHPVSSAEDHTEAALDATDPERHGTIFIHGGCTASGRLNDLWGFDVAARTWSPFPDAPGVARGGSCLTFAQDRLYRFGGFDGKGELGGQIDVLQLSTTTFHDQGGRGELAVFSPTGKWESIAPTSKSPMPGNRSVAGLQPVTTGQGRNYLILFLGEKDASSSGHEGAGSFWDDVWSFQLRPQGMTAASFKDATKELFGAQTSEHTWAPVDIPEDSKTGGSQEAPGQLGWFASAQGYDMDPGSVVLWGGIRSNNARAGEGWILTPTTSLSTKRKAPIPALSFKSLSPFQSFKSSVSSPGSLYLSPPISSPSLMSPPPWHEGDDYLSLHGSHSGKKKHHSRTPGASRSSPLVDDGPSRHKPIVGESKNASTSQSQFRGHDWPPTVLPVESKESPAVLSLRRLSRDASDNVANAASTSDNVPKSLLKAVESIFTTKDAVPSSQKSSDGDFSPPMVGLRRSSTALWDGDRRRSSKSETKKALLGLGVPATIILRKATGMFPATAAPKDITTGDPSDAKESRPGVPPTCTLIGFGSRPLDGPERVLGEENEQKQRRMSTFSMKGHDLLASTSNSSTTGGLDSRQQSLAETAITVANMFPSAAILVSPAKSSPVTIESERRLSVVQIKSRKSVHQVIWREDDTSSSSATSLDPISPTDSLSAKDLQKVEDTPPQNSVTASDTGTKLNLALPNCEEQGLPPDVLTQDDPQAPIPIVLPRRGDQMFGWSWGTNTQTSDTHSNDEGTAKGFPSVGENEGMDHVCAASGMVSGVPQLFVPGDEDHNPTHTNQAPYVSRRASFAMNPLSLMTTGAGRELGSRRSISVHPSLLASMEEGDNLGQEHSSAISRRLSRVY